MTLPRQEPGVFCDLISILYRFDIFKECWRKVAVLDVAERG
jgi:hypothetical protein